MKIVWCLGACALSTFLGCGGRVEVTPSPLEPARYTVQYSDHLPASGAGVFSLAVSCERQDIYLDGGCELGAGGELVQSEALSRGWTCAAKTARDDVPVRVWADCLRAP